MVRTFPSGAGYTSPEALVGRANSPYADVHPVIAPDESYVIFDSTRPDGMGWADLYISFRRPDGTWGEAVPMGEVVNNRTNNICPSLSPDGEFLFFTSNNDIYWVSTEAIAKLRQ